TPMWLSCDQIVSLIRGAGKEPVERDSLYRTVRTFEDWVPGQTAARPEGPEGPTFAISHRPRALARGQRGLPVVSAVDGAEGDSAGSATSTASRSTAPSTAGSCAWRPAWSRARPPSSTTCWWPGAAT